MISIEKLFELYFECRKTKRRATGALAFEIDYEENLLELCDELNQRTWKPGACNCFIVEKPVKREIFAAPFKDRIVHHILIDALNPCFERFFIKDSFACRTGKGTLAAIKRLAYFVNSASQNGKKSAYIRQEAQRGVPFLGAFIKPNLILAGRRVQKNFVQKMQAYERLAHDHKPTKEEKNAILASTNSYLGILRQYKSWKLRVAVLKKHFAQQLSKHFGLKKDALKLEKKKWK